MSLHLKTLTGADLAPYLSDLAALRIEVFREWPYLYEGNPIYEEKYLKAFAQAPNAVLVLAFDAHTLLGASTGLPLRHETANIIKPFTTNNWAINDIFYLSESVLKAPYRGQGLGVGFFRERETWAKSLGFKWATFCGVIRPENHPLRPANAVPLDNFWQKRGYTRTDLICEIEWQDLDKAEETAKPLRFWTKQL